MLCKKRLALYFSISLFILFTACNNEKKDVKIRFVIPALNTLIYDSFYPVGIVFRVLLSCTAPDMSPVLVDTQIDFSETAGQYEFVMKIPRGKGRHFSAMIYAVGPDPAKHPRTYFLAGDGGYVDIEGSELTVEINMLYLLQFGDTNIFIDSRDRVWFAITPLYQYTGGIVKGLVPEQFEQVTQGGIGVFDGVQFFFVSLDSFIAQRGLDFSRNFFYLTDMDGNDNTIWLGSSNGVFVFDTGRMQFVDFYDVDITGKIQFYLYRCNLNTDPNYGVDYSTQNLCEANCSGAGNCIPVYDQNADYVTQVMVKRFQQGAGSEVWFLMGNGLESGGIVVHNFVNQTFSIVQGTEKNSYHFITEDPTQSIVYSGKYYDSSTGYDYNLTNFIWDGSKWASSGRLLNGAEILTMHFDSTNNMWFSIFDSQNLNELLLSTSILTSDLFQLSSNFIYLVGPDGLSLNGINAPGFQYNVSDINSFGNLYYFGSDAGLIIYDKSLNEWNLLERINSYIYDNYVRGIRITSYGDVWFTSGVFPTMLPAGVKTGERTTRHPDGSRVVDAIPITTTASWLPYSIAITPDGNRIYVGWQDYNTTDGKVSEINLTTKTKNVPDISLGQNAFPFYVRMSPDGSKLYASDSPGDRIWVVDLVTKSVAQYPTNPSFGPFNFVVSKDGTKGYFLNDSSLPYGIKIVDLASSIGSVIADIQITDAFSVNDMVITADESTAYVAGMDMSYYNKIYKIDLVNRTARILIDFSSVQYQPGKLLLDEQNNRIIASGFYIDAYQLAEIPLSDPLNYTIHYSSLPGSVSGMLLTPDADLIFLTSWSNYFNVFDAEDLKRVRAQSQYTAPGWQGGPMVSSPDGKTVFVLTQGPSGVGYPLNLEIIK